MNFPTALHRQAAELTAQFFAASPQVDTILVVNSCARGQATPDSDLDMAILAGQAATPEEVRQLEAHWLAFAASHPTLDQFRQMGPHAKLHLDVIRGQYTWQAWDDGGGPDYFEVELGNQLAYAAPMRTPGPFYRELQSVWLPYYAESVRLSRLAMVRAACLYDLDYIPHYVRRGLYFQAFDRLYKAFQEFLQALFIARQTYPLAYNKWIRMQVEDWLGLPELYAALPGILSVSTLDSEELVDKANLLRGLLETWT